MEYIMYNQDIDTDEKKIEILHYMYSNENTNLININKLNTKCNNISLYEYNEICGDIIPMSIQKLLIFNSGIVNNLSLSINHLEISRCISKIVDNLSCNLNYLQLGNIHSGITSTFNGKLNNLPNTIKQINIISCRINKKITLPEYIEKIIVNNFYLHYNKKKIPISINILPAKLCYLDLNRIHFYNNNFNLKFNNLNKNLKQLILRYKFNNIINNLPINTQNLLMHEYCFNKNIKNLPCSILNLTFERCSYMNKCIKFPHMINDLKLFVKKECIIENLPISLKSLTIAKNNINDNIFGNLINLQNLILLKCRKFNSSLNNLSFLLRKMNINNCDDFNKELDNLSLNLLYLNMKSINFDKIIDNLPSKLSHISINSNNFNQLLNNLPLNLNDLLLYCNSFNKKLSKLPTNITLLYCCENELKLSCNIFKLMYFNKIKITNLPNTLKILQINYHNEYLDMLPEGLEVLILSPFYEKRIDDLPSSIKEIWTSEDNSKYINNMYKNKIKIIKNLFNMINVYSQNEIDYIYESFSKYVFDDYLFM